jgi:hypothetical protein
MCFASHDAALAIATARTRDRIASMNRMVSSAFEELAFACKAATFATATASAAAAATAVVVNAASPDSLGAAVLLGIHPDAVCVERDVR